MTISQSLPLAVALVKSTLNWTWQLRIDDNGFYRWYLDGAAATELRGCTRSQADFALRRFVEQSLRCDLEIIDVPERIAADHEGNPVGKNLKVTA